MESKRLGRGLDHLMKDLGQQDAAPDRAEEPPQGGTVAVDLVDANPYQPRQGMDASQLEGLKASLREHGVLQPIIVRRVGDRFEVVVGERRLRAAREVGMEEVPAVVRDVPDDRMLEIALIENLQREDLDAIEKAQSFRVYLAETGLTQEEASKRLGLDRSTIANMIRLLELPEEVQGLVRHGMVAMGHARALLCLRTGSVKWLWPSGLPGRGFRSGRWSGWWGRSRRAAGGGRPGTRSLRRSGVLKRG